jgi:hypothetical protein
MLAGLGLNWRVGGELGFDVSLRDGFVGLIVVVVVAVGLGVVVFVVVVAVVVVVAGTVFVAVVVVVAGTVFVAVVVVVLSVVFVVVVAFIVLWYNGISLVEDPINLFVILFRMRAKTFSQYNTTPPQICFIIS